MEAAFHDHDSGGVDAFFVTIQASQLDCRLVGLGTGVTEKDTVHTGQCCELLAQGLLVGDAVEVGGMHQLAGLLAQCPGYRRVGMTEVAHGNPAYRIQVLPAFRIP